MSARNRQTAVGSELRNGGTRRRAPACLAVAVLTALALMTGCGQTNTAESIRIDELAEVHVGLDHELRLGRELAAGSHAIAVPINDGGAQLRLGVLPREEGSVPLKVRVSVGRDVLLDETASDSGVWYDRLVALPTGSAGECIVEIEAPGPVALGPCEIVPARSEKTSVLVFLIDALRLDHLGCYGYERETSPNIDAFAQDAVRFTQLMPQASWTRPSVASLLTSTYPPVHGATMTRSRVNFGLPFLSTCVRDAGYATEGFIANPSLLPTWGFGISYDRYFDIDCENWLHSDDAKVVDRVLLSLDEAGGKSWYYYIHAMGPHDPYEPPAPYDQTFARDKYADDEEQARRQRLLDLYDGEILYTDLQFGRLIGGLKARGLYDNTLIIVVADHGEEFWEHGDEGHGKTLYEEQLRIPFLMRLPGGAHGGKTLEELVEMVDIAPTVLEMIGLPPQPRFQGRSLAHYIESGELDPQPGYANLELHGKNLVTVKTPRDKMIEDRTEHRVSWYDLEVDPGEHAPSSEAPERAVHLPRHAEDVEMGTVQGLHLLVTFAAGDETRLRGCLEGEGLASHRVHAPIREARASREESHVLFSALPGADDGDEEMTRADYMHLFVSMWPSAQVTLTLEADNADGEPVELFVAGMGEDAEAVLLDGPLDLNALTAPPQVINPAGLPRETKAYLWYVMPGQELTEEEVPEETLKALEALGYVD